MKNGYKLAIDRQYLIIPEQDSNIEQNSNNEKLYDLLGKKDRTKTNYDICIYLLPESKIDTKESENTKLVECNKCTYLNNILNYQCEICLNTLAQNRSILKIEMTFDCSLCLDKNLPIQTGICLNKCSHSFCKYESINCSYF